MLVKALGETIKNRRKELRITQPHLAELANVSTNTLYKLERGQGNPSLDVLNKFSDFMGVFSYHLKGTWAQPIINFPDELEEPTAKLNTNYIFG